MGPNVLRPASSAGDPDPKVASPSPSPSASPAPSGLAGCSSSRDELQSGQPVLHEANQAAGDNSDLAGIPIKSTVDNKNKQIAIYDMDGQEQAASHNVIVGSNTFTGHQNDALGTYEPEWEDFNYDDQEDNKEHLEYDDEYEYDDELIERDFNFNLSAKFDDMDIPPGIEASVPWLQKAAPVKSSTGEPYPYIGDGIDNNFKLFKQFDTVQDFSDHHFAKYEPKEPPKDLVKRIQHEWKLLENDLPESIFVRVYEDRMDLLRAVIVGPAGTPYHDGLFFFDVQFPSNYPQHPPDVHYHSGGLRLNPNLYDSGKVCLSLLGTWTGKGCENWNPSASTMLQVLVSIQALVLNENPYFNEPGFEGSANTDKGKERSLAYNKDTFVLSLRTMLYSLRRPPKHFTNFVAGHFRKHGHTILAACKAYMEGIQVGSAIKEEEDQEDEEKMQDVGGSAKKDTRFSLQLEQLFEDLLMEFTVKGAKCDKFLAQKIKAGKAKAVAT